MTRDAYDILLKAILEVREKTGIALDSIDISWERTHEQGKPPEYVFKDLKITGYL